MKKYLKKSIEIYGWLGAAAIICAYSLISFNVVTSHSMVYQLLNVCGAVGIVAVSYKDRDYQSVVLNLIFSLIGIITILNILFFG